MPKSFKTLNSKGLTLVEVMASILIIGIILLSFSSLLLQGAKTGESSEEIVDYTYLAQTAMETIYSVSKNQHYSTDLKTEVEQDLVRLGYRKVVSESTATKLVFDTGDILSNEYVKIEASIQLDATGKTAYGNLVNVLLVVQDYEKTKAQLEYVISWKVTT